LFDEGGGDVFEDFAALPAGQGAGAAQAGDGVVDGLAGIGAGGDGDAADEALIPGRADFKRISVDPFLAAQQKARLRRLGASSWRGAPVKLLMRRWRLRPAAQWRPR
jgi:hypothetical protein